MRNREARLWRLTVAARLCRTNAAVSLIEAPAGP